ncbi:unnamed protein product [marine sediment metagenome]|uniref:Uncharacterized protein n=1 Tax=marine sediment metagenome TaxID=412755 RepID=X1SDC3_9ZZZZ
MSYEAALFPIQGRKGNTMETVRIIPCLDVKDGKDKIASDGGKE